jgi:hypothetical protein
VTADDQENPLRKYVFAVAAVVFGTGFCSLSAAQTTRAGAASSAGSSNTTATAPASAPALAPQEIAARQAAARAVLQDFFKAMFAGDQKGALALLLYTDVDEAGKPKSKEKAETMLGEVLAEQRLRMAVTKAFGNVPFKLGRGNAEVTAFHKDFETATVQVNADGASATVSMPLGIAYVLIWKDGKWMIDFDKTQAGIGPLPRVEDLDALTKITGGYDQLAKDVAAKKYETVDEVTKEVDKIMAVSTMKETDTKPATTAATPAGTGTRP